MPKPKKVEIQQEAEDVTVEIPEDSDKQELVELYATMKKLGINSIGDVEVKLSKYNK
jgi:hypothetical protein